MRIKLFILCSFFITSLTAQDWKTLYADAKKDFNHQQYNEASVKLQKIMAEYQNKIGDLDSLYSIKNLLGLANLKIGQYDQGTAQLQQSIKYYQKDNLAHTNLFVASSQLAIHQFKNKQLEDSKRNFSLAISSGLANRKKYDNELIVLTKYWATIEKAYHHYPIADSLYQIVLVESERLVGKKDINYKNTLETVTKMHLEAGRYTTSINYLKDLLLVIADLDGVKSKEHALKTSKLVEVYLLLGQADEALALQSKNLKTYKKSVGTKDELYIRTAIHLGDLYRGNQSFQKAKKHYSLAEENIQSVTDKSLIGTLYNNFGVLFDQVGDYDKAQFHLKKAIEAYEEHQLTHLSAYITSLINLGESYTRIEEMTKAETYMSKANQLSKSNTSIPQEQKASIANNLAVYYQRLGRYNEALVHYKEAIDLLQNSVGQQDIRFTKTLASLGSLYEETAEFEQAEKLYSQALSIISKSLGQSHPHFAEVLNNKAKLLLVQNKLDEAQEAYETSMSIMKDVYGKKSLHVSIALNNLGRVAEKKGEYKKALKYYNNSLDIKSEYVGDISLSVTEINGNIARIYEALGNQEQAFIYWKKTITDYLKLIDIQFTVLSEREKAAFYNKIRNQFEQFNNFVVAHHQKYPEALDLMYNTQLKTKAMLIKATNKLRSQVLNSNDPSLIALYQNWISSKELLAEFHTTKKYYSKARIDSLDGVVNQQEKQLSKKVSTFSSATEDHFTWKDVKTKLSPGETAIEMIRFHKYDPINGGTRHDNIRYYACLILTASTTSHPELVLLNNGYDLDGKVLRAYRNSIKFQLTDKKSYYHYWERIKKSITGTKKLYFSPDGVYNSININSILNPETGHFIIDELDIEIVTNTKDLLVPTTHRKVENMVVLGNPDFKSISTIQEDLEPLPGAEDEAQLIANIGTKNKVKTNLLLNHQADEASIKDLKNAQVVHIATHGFFKSDVKDESGKTNPLLRSGIYLSSTGSKEDGVLHAYEAMNLNLENTELVVLSACETGLGEVANGEGVYGLQRAIRVAGASSLAISLWKVSDESTQLLMVTFYEEWLNSGNKQEAFRKAQFKVREKYPSPFYWAAFILVGE